MVEALRRARPDVVALQECAWRFRHQASQLGAALRMPSARAGTLGVLSDLPFSMEVRRLPSGARGGSKRALLVDTAGLRIVVLHLPLSGQVRESQARTFVGWAHATEQPIVLCGDFNEPPEGRAVTLLRENGFVDAWTTEGGQTWPLPDSRARIDFILTRGNVRVTATSLLAAEPPASDHLGVLADIRLGSK